MFILLMCLSYLFLDAEFVIKGKIKDRIATQYTIILIF